MSTLNLTSVIAATLMPQQQLKAFYLAFLCRALLSKIQSSAKDCLHDKHTKQTVVSLQRIITTNQCWGVTSYM